MSYDGYLSETGWIRSFLERQPVNREGEPIPWLTHAFSAFLTPRLRPGMKMLEFGAGHSTIFYSKILNSITSIESDPGWVDRVRQQVNSERVNLILRDGSEYWECLAELNECFDIIIVDGKYRFECARTALNYLTPAGVIVLDNSSLAEYQPIYPLLQNAGFRNIDFFGPPPGKRRFSCTTVFYRDGNCLKI
jgi:hypothetical protein